MVFQDAGSGAWEGVSKCHGSGHRAVTLGRVVHGGLTSSLLSISTDKRLMRAQPQYGSLQSAGVRWFKGPAPKLRAAWRPFLEQGEVGGIEGRNAEEQCVIRERGHVEQRSAKNSAVSNQEIVAGVGGEVDFGKQGSVGDGDGVWGQEWRMEGSTGCSWWDLGDGGGRQFLDDGWGVVVHVREGKKVTRY